MNEKVILSYSQNKVKRKASWLPHLKQVPLWNLYPPASASSAAYTVFPHFGHCSLGSASNLGILTLVGYLWKENNSCYTLPVNACFPLLRINSCDSRINRTIKTVGLAVVSLWGAELARKRYWLPCYWHWTGWFLLIAFKVQQNNWKGLCCGWGGSIIGMSGVPAGVWQCLSGWEIRLGAAVEEVGQRTWRRERYAISSPATILGNGRIRAKSESKISSLIHTGAGRLRAVHPVKRTLNLPNLSNWIIERTY